MIKLTSINWKKWIAPGCIKYAGFEWVIMRLIFAWVLSGAFRLAGYDCLRPEASPGRQLHAQGNPRGFAQFFDLTWICDPAIIPGICISLFVLLVVFVSGLAPFLSSLGLLVFLTCVGTLENSQGGNVYHTSQILALVLLGVCLGRIYEIFQSLQKGTLRETLLAPWKWLSHVVKHPSAWMRRAGNHTEAVAEKHRSLQIYTVQQLLVMSYVVSAITKLIRSKGAWISDVQNIGLQMVKNLRYDYYDSLDDKFQSLSGIVRWVNANPGLTQAFLAIGLLLELFAFVALFNRGFMALFALGLMAMHVLISHLMELHFEYHKWLLAVFFINVPYWLWSAGRKLTQHKGA